MSSPVGPVDHDTVLGRHHRQARDGGLELFDPAPGPIALALEGAQLGARHRLRDRLLHREVLEIALAALLVEPGLQKLDPLLDLRGHLGLELGLAEVGRGLGRLLLDVEPLHAEVDLLLLDLLGGFLVLGLLLDELALQGFGVEGQDAVALLDGRALGDHEGDLEVPVADGRHPDLGGADGLKLAFDLDGFARGLLASR